MHKKRMFLSALILCLAIMACNLPASQQKGAQPNTIATLTVMAVQTQGSVNTASAASTEAANTAIASAPPAATLPASATACPPVVTANSSVNVRSGPGTVYDIIGALSTGGTTTVNGKSADGAWWYITFPSGPGGYGWVSASVVTTTCITASLAVVAAPPTPLPASGTCMAGYTWRLIQSSDKICVSPASASQAQADDAAAASRLCTAAYGPKTCAQGYVWRGAYSGDYVCVTPSTHSQAMADNAAASSRWTSGAYGPHTCISGYVWRAARSGDNVCVTPAVNAQTAADNSAAASHLCTSAFGPNTCASGYFWRQAFSGDNVCVTPAVKNQTVADNAAAASHTWP
jgi:uncharacterized protein YraI